MKAAPARDRPEHPTAWEGPGRPPKSSSHQVDNAVLAGAQALVGLASGCFPPTGGKELHLPVAGERRNKLERGIDCTCA